MTDEQYQATQDALVALYQQLVMYNLDLSGFLARIQTAETVCPILDPTLWIKGSDNLEMIKRMAEGLQPAMALVQELRATLKAKSTPADTPPRFGGADYWDAPGGRLQI